MGLASAPDDPASTTSPGAAAHLTDLDLGTRRRVVRTIRLAIVEGSLTQVFLNWTTGGVLVGFMLHLGATPVELALVSAVPQLSHVVSPAAAYLAAAIGRRKMLVVVAALLSRLTWLLAAALPLVDVPDALRPMLMLFVVLLASVFLAANTTLWTAWMGDVVPERERGRTFGLRSGVVGVVGMVANLSAGVFLDRVGAPVSFQVALVVAVLVGLLGVAIYLAQYDPPSQPERVRWRQLFVLPWRDRGFRRLLRFTIYWNFVVMLSGPFVTPYLLQEVGFTFTQLAIASSITALTALVTTYGWGRVADRWGHRNVLGIGTFLVGLLLPTGWILAGITGVAAWVWATAAFDALAWGAARLAAFNLALQLAPRANRVVFIAMLGLAAGVAGFAGGVVAGPLLLFLQRFEMPAFGTVWTGYHWLFTVAAVLRMQGWWWLRGIPDGRLPSESPRPPAPEAAGAPAHPATGAPALEASARPGWPVSRRRGPRRGRPRV